MSTISIKEWIKQIDGSLPRLRTKSNHENKVDFVRRVMSWPTFGETSFTVEKPVIFIQTFNSLSN